MFHESDSNQIPILQSILRFLQFFGGIRKKNNILTYITMVSLSCIITLQGLDVSLNWTGVETLKRVIFMPAVVLATIKTVIIFTNGKAYLEALAILKNFWRADAFDPDTKKQFDYVFQFITTVCRLFYANCFFLGFLIVMTPFRDMENRKLIIAEYPLCDVQGNFWCWFVMYLWQCYVVMGQVIPMAMSFDCIFVIWVAYIYNGCKLLKVGMGRLNTEKGRQRQIILRQTVEQHDIVLKFVKRMDEMFADFMFIQFCSSLGSLTLMLYMMVVDNFAKPAETAYFVGLYCIFTCQGLLYALGGTIIEEQINSIPAAIYGVDWYSKGRTHLRKDLAFMILRTQNTRLLSVGKLTGLNLKLFVAVIRNSVSLVTVIRQFEEN